MALGGIGLLALGWRLARLLGLLRQGSALLWWGAALLWWGAALLGWGAALLGRGAALLWWGADSWEWENRSSSPAPQGPALAQKASTPAARGPGGDSYLAHTA